MDLTALRTEFLARGFQDLEASGTNTRKDVFLNRSYHEICEREAWPFLETTATGTSPLTISDLRAVLAVVDSTNKNILDPIDYRDILETDPGLLATGAAEFWYRTSPTIITSYPPPAVSLSVRYLKVPTDLSSGTDVPVIPTRFQYLIIEGAMMYAYRDVDNYEASQNLSDVFEGGLLKMADSLLVTNLDSPYFMGVSDSTDW